jgi:hypothetical protein
MMDRETRERVEALIEGLIALLDAADGEADLEDGHDAEFDWAEWGVADSGALDDVKKEIWFRRAFAAYRATKRDAASRAAAALTAE